MSVVRQEIIHPYHGGRETNLNILKDTNRTLKELTDIVRGEYGGSITYGAANSSPPPRPTRSVSNSCRPGSPRISGGWALRPGDLRGHQEGPEQLPAQPGLSGGLRQAPGTAPGGAAAPGLSQPGAAAPAPGKAGPAREDAAGAWAPAAAWPWPWPFWRKTRRSWRISIPTCSTSAQPLGPAPELSLLQKIQKTGRRAAAPGKSLPPAGLGDFAAGPGLDCRTAPPAGPTGGRSPPGHPLSPA